MAIAAFTMRPSRTSKDNAADQSSAMSAEDKILALKKRKQAKRNAARMRQIERLFVQKQQLILEIRLKEKPIARAFMYAILGNEYKLKQELEFGHDVDERDMTSGRTVLLEAVAAGHFHIVRMLLNNYKPNLQVPTFLGQTSPLHMAVEKGYRQITSILLTCGADYDALDKRGCTPLHGVKKLSLLKLLFKTRIDACIRSKEGLTPYFHYLKYVPKEEQIPDIIAMMAEREDRRAMEMAKEQVAENKLARDRFIASFVPVISSDSTIQDNYVTRGHEKEKNEYRRFSKVEGKEYADGAVRHNAPQFKKKGFDNRVN